MGVFSYTSPGIHGLPKITQVVAEPELEPVSLVLAQYFGHRTRPQNEEIADCEQVILLLH